MIKLQTRHIVAFADLSGYACLSTTEWAAAVRPNKLPMLSSYVKDGETPAQALARFARHEQMQHERKVKNAKWEVSHTAARVKEFEEAHKRLAPKKGDNTLHFVKLNLASSKVVLRKVQKGYTPAKLIVIEETSRVVAGKASIPVAKKGKK